MVVSQLAAAFGWFVLALAAVYAVGLVRAAVRAVRTRDGGPEPHPEVDRADLLRRALATTTAVVAARALGPGHELVTVLWAVLVAAWAWGLVTSATAWRRLPWRREASPCPRRTAAGLAAESGLLVLAVVVLVP